MARALDASPIRALIVEDNRDICDNIATYLERSGYVLDFAHDGVAAMNLALVHPFDVIVLDLMMPRMDGLTFCQRLRTDAASGVSVMPATIEAMKAYATIGEVMAVLRDVHGAWVPSHAF